MITIISSARYKELLDKERAADAIDDELRLKAAFTQAPNLDVQRELASIHSSINVAYGASEAGSVVRSHLLDAQVRLGTVIKAIA